MEGLDTRPFDVCLVLLRGHRAGFEGPTLGEQLGQLERAFAYVELMVSNAKKRARFLEYGDEEGVPTRTSETAQRQVAAALRRDAAGLTTVQIADELGINKPGNVRIKSDVSQVRREAEAGRELHRRALGDAEAADLIRKRKAEFEWWQTLTEDDWWVYDGWPEDLVGGLDFSGGTVPDKTVDIPRLAREEVRALSPVEAKAFLEAARGDRYEGLYVVAVTAGLRHGEILGLRRSDVDLENGTLRVARQLQRMRDRSGLRFSAPKGGKGRTMSLPRALSRPCAKVA